MNASLASVNASLVSMNASLASRNASLASMNVSLACEPITRLYPSVRSESAGEDPIEIFLTIRIHFE